MSCELRIDSNNMRSNLYSGSCSGCITDLSNKYNCSIMSDTGSNKYSIYQFARISQSQRSMQLPTKTHYRTSTKCLWRKYNCDLYIYQQLCTDSNNMRSNLYSGSSTGCITDLSNKYNCSIMSDTGSNKYSIYQLAGNSKFQWWM